MIDEKTPLPEVPKEIIDFKPGDEIPNFQQFQEGLVHNFEMKELDDVQRRMTELGGQFVEYNGLRFIKYDFMLWLRFLAVIPTNVGQALEDAFNKNKTRALFWYMLQQPHWRTAEALAGYRTVNDDSKTSRGKAMVRDYGKIMNAIRDYLSVPRYTRATLARYYTEILETALKKEQLPVANKALDSLLKLQGFDKEVPVLGTDDEKAQLMFGPAEDTREQESDTKPETYED